MEWRTTTPEETASLGAELAPRLIPAGVLLLRGELAAGKTVLTRGLAGALGIPADQIQSPSYTLVHEHVGTAGELIHIDLYRLGPDEVLGIGIEDLLDRPAIKVIEWPERLPFALPDAWQLEISTVGDGQRRLTLQEPASSS